MDSNDLQEERLHVFITFGKYHRDEDSLMDRVRKRWTLACVRSLSKTTDNVVVHFVYCNLDENFVRCLSRLAKFDNPTCEFLPEFMSRESILDAMGNCSVNNIGPHSAVRLVLHRLHPELDSAVWLDCDTVVRESLWNFVAESREALEDTGFCFAGAVESRNPDEFYINAGVMYIDFRWLREHPFSERNLLDLMHCTYDRDHDDGAQDVSCIERTMYDQAIVNVFGTANVDRRWNVTAHTIDRDVSLTDDGIRRDVLGAGVIHFTGTYKSGMYALMQMPGWRFLKDLWDEIGRIVPVHELKYPSDVRQIEHVYGREPVPVNRMLKPRYGGYDGDTIHVIASVSGMEYMRNRVPVMAYSLAKNCSKRTVVHVIHPPEMSSDEFFSFMDRLGGVLSGHGSRLELHEAPEDVIAETTIAGDRELDQWKDHMLRMYAHEIVGEADIAVLADCDVLFNGDLSDCVDYCVSRGLGRDVDVFTRRSSSRQYFWCELNSGVCVCSLDAFRRKNVSREIGRLIAAGPYPTSDEMYTSMYLDGVLEFGWLPYQYAAMGYEFEGITYVGWNRYPFRINSLEKIYLHGTLMPVDGERLPVYKWGMPFGDILHFCGLQNGMAFGEKDDTKCPVMPYWDSVRREVEELMAL